MSSYLGGFASELRMIEKDSLAYLIKARRFSDVDFILRPIIELHCPSGQLVFSLTGDTQSHWDDYGFVSMDFEFILGDASIFFTLRLNARSAALQIVHIIDDKSGSLSTGSNLQYLLRRTFETPPKTH